MELTPEDKERIEQEARKIAAKVLGFKPDEILPDDTILYGAIHGAEYATIYEREKQAKLRNKVIDEAVAFMMNTLPPGSYEYTQVVKMLNSLKTK